MLTRVLTTTLLAVAVTFAGPAWSYDAAMAQSYAKLFAPVKGAGAGKAMHLIKPDDFLNKVKAKEPLVVLDVRTPAETSVYSATLPGTLVISIDELFTEANLLAYRPTRPWLYCASLERGQQRLELPFVISVSRMSMFSRVASKR